MQLSTTLQRFLPETPIQADRRNVIKQTRAKSVYSVRSVDKIALYRRPSPKINSTTPKRAFSPGRGGGRDGEEQSNDRNETVGRRISVAAR